MANNICELAQEALQNGNYQLAVELYECILQMSDKLSAVSAVGDGKIFSRENYTAYGVALARCGRIRECFEVLLFVCSQLGQTVPLDKLKQVSVGLLEGIAPDQAAANLRVPSTASVEDAFACPFCDEVLVCPVTMTCGHTFCRDCVEDQQACFVCDQPFLLYGKHFKQDVLVSRLVEKWWAPNIQARFHNDEAQAQLQQDELDRALKSCNTSLGKCKLYISFQVQFSVHVQHALLAIIVCFLDPFRNCREVSGHLFLNFNCLNYYWITQAIYTFRVSKNKRQNKKPAENKVR